MAENIYVRLYSKKIEEDDERHIDAVVSIDGAGQVIGRIEKYRYLPGSFTPLRDPTFEDYRNTCIDPGYRPTRILFRPVPDPYPALISLSSDLVGQFSAFRLAEFKNWCHSLTISQAFDLKGESIDVAFDFSGIDPHWPAVATCTPSSRSSIAPGIAWVKAFKALSLLRSQGRVFDLEEEYFRVRFRDNVLGNALSELKSLFASLEDEPPPIIPPQSPALIQVALVEGVVAPVEIPGPLLAATQVDFDDWRSAVSAYCNDLLATYFRDGTNHPRIRERLLSIGAIVGADSGVVMRRQFDLGVEVQRTDVLTRLYSENSPDLPAIGADALEDLKLFLSKCEDGLRHLGRWTEFSQEARSSATAVRGVDQALVAAAAETIADEMERQPTVFDRKLPATLRFLADALRDPAGAALYTVYGSIRGIENIFKFLATTALEAAKEAIKKPLASAITFTMGVTLAPLASKLSSALPSGWTWLQPALDAISRLQGLQ